MTINLLLSTFIMSIFQFIASLFFMFGNIVIFVYGASSFTKCNKINSCSCKTETGQVVNLKPLVISGTKARFSDVKSGTGDLFSWNPCTDFTETDACSNVAACQIQSSTPPNLFPLGSQNTATFTFNGNKNLEISYEKKDKFDRKSFVELICDEKIEAEFTAQGEIPPAGGKYYMSLKSKYACPITPGPDNGSDGLSPGSIVCIIALVLVIVYISAGIAIQKFAKQASGKEMMPNYTLWVALPGLVKGGVLFTISKCRPSKSYDNI